MELDEKSVSYRELLLIQHHVSSVKKKIRIFKSVTGLEPITCETLGVLSI